MISMRTKLTLVCCAVVAATGTHAKEPRYELPALERLASPELTTFEDDREFRAYLKEVRRIERRRRNRRADANIPTFVIAASTSQQAAQPEECLDTEKCPEDDRIVVTGSRVSTPPVSSISAVTTASGTESESITNNQVLGVEEGDIVKRIGHHLLVLQDGRIFVADFRTMQLTDRIDVYRRDEDGDPIAADWYDEMLVQRDQVIITAYNYEEEASEISVFGFDRAAGKLTRRGVFLLTSDDYYDVDNYATRVVDDKLVIYTPYEPEQLANRRSRPVVRRWTPGDDFDGAKAQGRRILNADDIYRPVFGVTEPTVHTVSICPLDRLDESGLRCRSTGFVGSELSVMYVGREAAYLYVGQPGWDDLDRRPDCSVDTPDRAAAEATTLGAIFRIDLNGRVPLVVGVRGAPFDQFSFGEDGKRFRMLAQWWRKGCHTDTNYDEPDLPQEVALFDIPNGRFSRTFREPSARVFTALPDATSERVVNRFVGDWLVYGARHNWSGRPPNYWWSDRNLESFDSGVLQAIPLAEPAQAHGIVLPYQITRIEALASGVVLTGYDLRAGLNIGYLDLRAEPRLANTTFLSDRFESENRSHAFNATLTADGGAVLGLPTVVRRRESGRFWWHSGTSDISFLTLSNAGSLADLGALSGKDEEEVETADGTMRRELSVLRAALNFAHSEGRITYVPPVLLPPKTPGKDRWLTRQEAAKLLNAARTASGGVRLYLPLFIPMGLYTGARKGAILSLGWPQVDLENGLIDFLSPGERQSNKRRAKIPIPNKLLGHLKRARLRGSDLGYVVHRDGKKIDDVKHSFASACIKAGVFDATPHTLRHTCGTWLAQKGVSLFEIGGWLGQSNERTVELYAHHHSDFLSDAKRAIDRSS